MKFAIGVANIYESRISVFVVDAPSDLLSVKGVFFDLVGDSLDVQSLHSMNDIQDIIDYAIEYDLLISYPVKVHDDTPLYLPNKNTILDDDNFNKDINLEW